MEPGAGRRAENSILLTEPGVCHNSDKEPTGTGPGDRPLGALAGHSEFSTAPLTGTTIEAASVAAGCHSVEITGCDEPGQVTWNDGVLS